MHRAVVPCDSTAFLFDKNIVCCLGLSCRWSQVELSWYEGQEKVDLTDYVNSGTWDIIACPGRNEKPSDKADDDGEFSVSQITFTLRIRRKVQLDA